MGPQNPWSDPNVPQPGFSLPVSIGPMALPAQKPERRRRGILAWSLFVFAAGIAAGPPLVDWASQGVEAGAKVLAKRAPRLLGRYRPVAFETTPPPPRRGVLASPPTAAKALPSESAPPAGAAPAPEPRQPVAGTAQRAVVAALPATPAETGPSEGSGRSGHPKKAAKVAAAPPRKSGRYRDPFESDDGAAAAPAPGSKHEPKVASGEPASESATRPAGGKSTDSLDSLLADAITDTKGKSKKRVSKDIDTMLKDVQKSGPASAAKPKAQADLPPLSAADISKAMAVVKTRSNECARKLGQKGIAQLNIRVGKNGRVADVRTGGKVAGTPLGSCIEKAARAASFPANAGLRFDYKIDAR